MPSSSSLRSLAAGALVANSMPHLASAAARRRHLTPLGGRQSSPGLNAVWGAANLVGGLALLRRAAGAPAPARWDERLHWFELGAVGFAAWMAGSELVLRVNTPSRVESRPATPPSRPSSVPAPRSCD